MSFLSPLALAWLGSLPVLLWLWRLHATHRHTRIPSLIPFERLVRRQAKRRTHLIVNLLFWLQLIALVGLVLALAQPVIFRRRVKTTLVVLDTSASMDARRGGTSAFERATRLLRGRLSHKPGSEQVLLMITSPVTALTPAPTADAEALVRALEGARVAHLSGNLATTARIGRALLGNDPDDTLVVTDEAAPPDGAGAHVRWVTVHASLPNTAIVGLDARGSLCAPADAHLVATVQNFSSDPASVTVTARQQGQSLAHATAELAPRARSALSLALPPQAQGWVDVTLTSARDALATDNHAWVQLAGDRLPIVVRSTSPAFTNTISAWLRACPALTWTAQTLPTSGAFLVVTDQDTAVPPAATGAVVFFPPATRSTIRSYWVASADHPISAYFSPVQSVVASLNLARSASFSGTPVISGLLQGRKVPIVVADERDRRPVVAMFLDPSGNDDTTPILLAFFNSVRWLMGHADIVTTGEPLTLGGFAPGSVRVHRPDGSMETVAVEGGLVRYEATTFAGPYRFTQGALEQTVAVNFFDPLESNTMDQPSTWHGLPPDTGPHGVAARVRQPLSHLFLVLIVAIVLAEWLRYCAKGRSQALTSQRSTGPHR